MWPSEWDSDASAPGLGCPSNPFVFIFPHNGMRLSGLHYAEKLKEAQLLEQEQLQLGHSEASVSPWNAPIFVIQKKKPQQIHCNCHLISVHKCYYDNNGGPPVRVPGSYFDSSRTLYHT